MSARPRQPGRGAAQRSSARRPRAGGDVTRARILEAALALFRKRGFDATTMRDVAEAAGMAIGAAYYYFPSKDALLLAYYDRVQDEHARRAGTALAELPPSADLRARLAAVFLTKLDVVGRDRKLLAAVFRSVGDPASPLGAFGSETGAIREKSVAVFAEAVPLEVLSEDARRLLPAALWLLHLGILAYFVRDRSPRQQRTRTLVIDAIDLLVPLVRIASTPALESSLGDLRALLERAGLWPALPEAS